MPDTTLSDLPAKVALALADLLYIVDSTETGFAASKKTTIQNLITFLESHQFLDLNANTASVDGRLLADIFNLKNPTAQNITAAADTISNATGRINLTSDGEYVMTSVPTIAAGTDGDLLFLHNVGNFTIAIVDDSVLSGSTIILGGSDSTIRPGAAVILMYSSATSKWAVIVNLSDVIRGPASNIIIVHNVSGGTLDAGTVVYVTGYDSGTGRITVGKADANDPAKMPAIGVPVADILNNRNGDVINSGNIIGLINTSTATLRDGVWVDKTIPGGVVFTKPTDDVIQQIGIVTRINANGNVLLQGSGHGADNPNNIVAKSLVLDTPLAIEQGGTASANAAAARIALDLEIGVDVQAHDAVLDATDASFLIADEALIDQLATLTDNQYSTIGDSSNPEARDDKGAISGSIITTTDGTFTIFYKLPFAAKATSVDAKTEGGTCSIQVLKAGSAINGFSSAVTQTTSNKNTVSTEVFAAGVVIAIVITLASSLINLAFSLNLTRTGN